jgi:uncharacterized phage infection (PIP) family protein YhgE
MGTNNSASIAAHDASDANNERQIQINKGLGAINNEFNARFTPKFYQQYGQNYSDYYTPQLQNQEQATRQGLNFALARAGITNSSTGAQQFSNLQSDFGQQNQALAGNELNAENTLKGQVQSSKTDLVNQLYSTADPEAAATSANASASMLAQNPGYSPLANAFGSFTNLLSNSARAQALSQPASPSFLYGYPGSGAAQTSGPSSSIQ